MSPVIFATYVPGLHRDACLLVQPRRYW